jgi:hypothetical protein
LSFKALATADALLTGLKVKLISKGGFTAIKISREPFTLKATAELTIKDATPNQIGTEDGHSTSRVRRNTDRY